MAIVDWVREHTELLLVWAALGTGLFTAVLAFLTARLVKESRRLRLDASRPEIVVYLRPHDAWINFVLIRVENVGRGTARNVQFTVKKDISFDDEAPISDIGIFKRGASHFPAGRVVEHFLLSLVGKLNQLLESPVSLEATYEDDFGNSYQQEFILDFSELEHLRRIGKDPYVSMAESLKNIEQTLKGVGSGHSKIRVRTKNEEVERGENLAFASRIEFAELSLDEQEEVIHFVRALRRRGTKQQLDEDERD